MFFFLLFLILLFHFCSNENRNKIVIESPTDATLAYNDTTVFNLVGYYHNIVLDTLIHHIEEQNLVDSIELTTPLDNWIYDNLFVKGYNEIKTNTFFSNIDSSGSYQHLVSFNQIMYDTTKSFEETLREIIETFCENDTLVGLVEQILLSLKRENYEEVLDSMMMAVEQTHYSELIKNVTRVAVSVSRNSMGYWMNFGSSTGIILNRKSKGDSPRILVAPAAIAACDVIGAIASCADSLIDGERNGWKIAGKAVLMGAATSAVAYLGGPGGSRAVAKFFKKFFNW
ncbi:MAG: hypothetical protein ACPLKS_08250 [Caldisericum exile]|uniref:hypothetical protein n=1 Tax=Caldisericum exile TaxID=693075 RepID=UPI003C778FDA